MAEEAIALLEKGPASRRDIQNELGISQTAAISLLNDLIERKVIEKNGGGRSTRYRLR